MSSQLEEDLARLWDETTTEHDIIAGLTILAELAGIATIFLIIFAIYAAIPGSSSLLRSLVTSLGNVAIREYSKLDIIARRQVRAVMRFLFPNPVEAIGAITDAGNALDGVDALAHHLGSIESYADRFRSLLEKYPLLLEKVKEAGRLPQKALERKTRFKSNQTRGFGPLR